MSETNAEEHIRAIVRILEDNQPHSVAELASLSNLSAGKIEALLRFMAEYNLVTYDEAGKTAAIRTDFSSLT
jgi:predicted transcriptional regulator